MGQLGADQVLDLHPPPFIPDKKVLIGCERLDALGEALSEMFGIAGSDLVGDRVHAAEHILGTMVDFARENVRLFCILPAFGNICDGADDARCPLPMLSATKICKPVNLHPADPAVFPLSPAHDR